MKVVGPVLARCFSLIGADVIQWYTEMPKLGKVQYHPSPNNFHSSIDHSTTQQTTIKKETLVISNILEISVEKRRNREDAIKQNVLDLTI